MRHTRLLAIAIGSVFLTNCVKESIQEPVIEDNIIHANIENNSTRSTVGDKGAFNWALGDKIAIHTTNGTWREGNLIGGEGTNNGTFQYAKLENEVLDGIAVYPYIKMDEEDAHCPEISGTELTLNLPATYLLGNNTNNTNAIMVAYDKSNLTSEGENNEQKSFGFVHLGGVMHFKFANVPASANRFNLTLNDSRISGEYTVDLSTEEPFIKLESTTNIKESMISMVFDELTESKDMEFYVPLPVGTYKGLKIQISDNNHTELASFTSTAQNTITRKKLLHMPQINFETSEGTIIKEVTDSKSLSSALAADGTVKLAQGISLEEPVTIPSGKNITIDLNGNSLENGGNTIIVGEGAKLNIVNNGESVAVKSGSEPSGATITSTSDVIKASANAYISIGGGVNLTTTGENSCCIWIPGNQETGIAENVYVKSAGNLTATQPGSAVIYHNGNLTTGRIDIIGGKIKHESDVAIYIAGKAEVNISGDTEVSGTTAIEQRAGTLNISGGHFVATAEEFKEQANGNGTTSEGAAVAICKHNTNFELTANITGGNFEGKRSVLVNDYNNEDKVSVNITGGSFSDPNACYHLGDNAKVTFSLAESYTGPGFKTKSGQQIFMDLNGNTYTVTAPLVGSPGTQTLGFQFNAGSTVKINNGTITSADAKMLIQNYSDLTLTDVTLTPSIPDTMNGQTYYVLSNNCGEVNITGSTSIVTPTKEGHKSYAFDVCKYASYEAPVVTVNTTGTITGLVEVSGGTLNVTAGTFNNETGHCVKVVNGAANFNGGTFTAQEVSVFNMAGKVNITNGVFTSKDNAVISGNGTDDDKYKNGTIEISGGTFNANIQTEGYVACGIYHPQKGTLKVTGGTFNINKGCGILMRGGSLDMTDSNASFTFTGDSTDPGMVGDSRVVVPCGKEIVKDAYSGYYDADNITITGVKEADDIFTVQN